MLKLKTLLAIALSATALISEAANAQSRVGPDSTPRSRRLVRDLGYGTLEGIGFAVIDQARDNPVEWSRDWGGYGQRVASNVGEFYIQEVVTEGLAAAMDRPLDYVACKCRGTIDRLGWAVRGALFDQDKPVLFDDRNAYLLSTCGARVADRTTRFRCAHDDGDRSQE